ncbi:MAG: TolC family protein [bacterium]
MNKLRLTTITFVLLYQTMFGQVYTLKDCINYAQQNNSNIKISKMNYEISEKQINETIATGLPQIDFTGTLTDNLKVTTSLLPGELMGQPGTFIPVKMGTKYNVSAGLKLTQKIFDPSFWVGLKAAKLSEKYYQQNSEFTSERTFYDVSSKYYKVIIAQKQLINLKSILETSSKSLNAVELKYQNGIAKKIDVDKIKVSYNKTKSQYQQTELNYKQAINNLKLSIGLPVDSPLELSDVSLSDIESFTYENINADNSIIEGRVDYKILKTQLELYETDRQNNVLSYLPTLSFFANFNYQAMRKEFNFFDSKETWFNSSAIGLELKIPIFSGLKRLNKVYESDINVEIAKENLKYSTQSIKVELSNYDIQYYSALDNIKNEKENLVLAESVFTNTQLEFSQGTGSSLDLIQAEGSLNETQNLYYTKLLNLYIAKLDLEKSKGTLINFINNQK